MDTFPVESCPGCMEGWLHAVITSQSLLRSTPTLDPAAIGSLPTLESEEDLPVEPVSPSSGITAAAAIMYPGEQSQAPGTLLDMLG